MSYVLRTYVSSYIVTSSAILPRPNLSDDHRDESRIYFRFGVTAFGVRAGSPIIKKISQKRSQIHDRGENNGDRP